MNKVEKIKAEIEKRKDEYMTQANSFESLGMTEKMDFFVKLASNMAALIRYIDSIEEESLSNDLEEAAYQYGNCFDNHFELASMSFIKGAKWQKKHLFDNRIKDCNNITEEQYNLESDFVDDFIDKHDRMPTFLDAIEYGMNYKNK